MQIAESSDRMAGFAKLIHGQLLQPCAYSISDLTAHAMKGGVRFHRSMESVGVLSRQTQSTDGLRRPPQSRLSTRASFTRDCRSGGISRHSGAAVC